MERLAEEELGEGVLVEELHYGAVAVAQRLEELRPDRLILVGAVARGRPPGTVERRAVEPIPLDTAEFQAAIGDAVTGYVGIDLVVEVASGFGALPAETVTIEVEPARVEPSETLSAEAIEGLEQALELVRRELARGRPDSEAERPAAVPRPSPAPTNRRSTS